MSSSPWGHIQNAEQYDRGFASVSTAGHGGFRCAPGWAAENLSNAARRRGMSWGGALWYEEDCDWAIVAWEVPQFWPLIFKHTGKDYIPGKRLLETLSSWNCDYLLEVGVKPDPKGQAYYDQSREGDRRRKEKDPDLIISTSALSRRPGIVEVHTADDQKHYVTSDSYAKREGLNLLSKCVLAAL